MIRATTSGVLKGYRSGLNKSFTRMNDARTTVMTHRTFNSYAEDPAAAAKAFQLRRARMTVEAQYNTCDGRCASIRARGVLWRPSSTTWTMRRKTPLRRPWTGH